MYLDRILSKMIVILLIIVSLLSIIGSFYGVGKFTEDPENKIVKNIVSGIGGFCVLILLGIIVYVFIKNYNSNTNISVLWPVVAILISTAIAGASAYGIGVEDSKKDKTALYDFAIVSAVISSFVLLVSVMIFIYKFNKINDFVSQASNVFGDIKDRYLDFQAKKSIPNDSLGTIDNLSTPASSPV